MLVGEKYVYLQLQKTGGTHIAKLLSDAVGGKQIGKHRGLTARPEGKAVFGSIRNPWDWYVSLWAYGCMKRGTIYAETTKKPFSAAVAAVRSRVAHPSTWTVGPAVLFSNMRKNAEFWEELYRDETDPERFRTWLRAILGSEDKTHLEDGYPFVPISDVLGLLTYRFLKTFSDSADRAQLSRGRWTRDSVKAFTSEALLADSFVRMEQLEDDLVQTLESLKIPFVSEKIYQPKTNASSRGAYPSYYDPQTAELVAEKEWLIIDRFGYEFGEFA